MPPLTIDLTDGQLAIVRHFGNAMGMSDAEAAKHFMLRDALDWYAKVMVREAREGQPSAPLPAAEKPPPVVPVQEPAHRQPLRTEGAHAAWTNEEYAKLRQWRAEGVSARQMADRLGRSVAAVNTRISMLKLPRGKRAKKNGVATPHRRFTNHAPIDPERTHGLADDHPAVIDGRTLFPSTVADPAAQANVLISGANSPKLGDCVVKGPWAGLPIYSLTLEERATCPRSCHVWRECYGNGMPMARRHRHGPELIAAIDTNLRKLLDVHEQGIVVRLHQLGDFYDNPYVAAWWMWLNELRALRVFGYTAHPKKSKIGLAIGELNHSFPDRCAIRFSAAEPQPMGATTIRRKDRGRVGEGIVCPAQTDDTACCGSCGLCWHPEARDKTIVFMLHGRKSAAEAKRNPAKAGKPWPAEKRTGRPALTESDNVREHGGVFSRPMQRRCLECDQIFKTRSVDQTVCGHCGTGASASP